MSSRSAVRQLRSLAVRLSESRLSLIGVVLTTSTAVTLIAFWIYDFMLPGPPTRMWAFYFFSFFPHFSSWDYS